MIDPLLAAATARLDPPFAVLDLAAARANLADLTRRAGGTPVRVASKSVRCRYVLDLALGTPGVAGVMAYSAAEARWLAAHGVDDVLVGYPSVDRSALTPPAPDAVTYMIDDAAQLPFLPAGARVCLDVDASRRIGRAHLGVRRSPIRTPTDAARLARTARDRGLRVDAVMFYEAQIAGLPDTSPAVRLVKRLSGRDLATRRGAVVRAVTDAVGPLRLVNSGGTGSVEFSASDPVVTEVTAGSGIYTPTLFDRYRSFAPRPALFLALAVVRRPAPRIATAFGGGYVASGPPGRTRLPSPLDGKLINTEGAGEVQTPVRGVDTAIGERLWFRPAKAGEQLERFDTLHVVDHGELVASVPTYRGEGKNFG